ncbi:hypothetical protein EDB19DRAFT_557829 [Suillus lakei]|nr:hypothetical protein EDB19DRAFT_557829 [Suillus lakei]
MTENNPPRKKRWGFLKRSRSDPHLAGERGRSPASDPSSLPPLRNESPRGSSGWFPSSWASCPRDSFEAPDSLPTLNPLSQVSSAHDLLHPQPSQSSDLRIANSEQPDPKLVKRRSRMPQHISKASDMSQEWSKILLSASNNLQSVPDTIDTFSTILGPLKRFNTIATGLADVHPYAKVALSIFTCASKMILDQANQDAAVSRLLSKISDVYALLMEREGLARIASMLEIYGKIARQTLECADFIVHYSDMKSFWKRLGKHVFNETEAAIQSHNEVLDNLMQQFRDQMALTTIETVHRIAEDLDVSGMEYVPGAGRNTSKNCLPGTREDILSEIKCWVRSTGEDVPRVLWLSGTAGKGKSAIAHTIANWSHERGGMRACFCFDRTREAERRHEKIFTTIARDVADCDISMRGALARAVHDDNELKHTIDISRQWQDH